MGIPGIRVELWNKEKTKQLGSGISDTKGIYSIKLDDSSLESAPLTRIGDLIFNAFDVTFKAFRKNDSKPVVVEERSLRLPTTTEEARPKINVEDIRLKEVDTISAKKRSSSNLPFKEPTTTKSPDLRIDAAIKTLGPNSTPESASRTFPAIQSNNNNKNNDIQQLQQQPPSEYEQLILQITPLLQKRQLADIDEEDIVFLAKETGIDKKHIEFLRQAAKLSEEIKLPAEIFYVLSRLKFPVNFKRLLAQDLDAINRSLETGINLNIIPASVIPAFRQSILRFNAQHKLLPKEFFGQLINKKTGAPLAGFTVHAYQIVKDNELEEDLGYDITNERGLFAVAYNIIIISKSPTAGSNPDLLSQHLHTQKLRLKISDQEAKEIYSTKVLVNPDEKHVKEIIKVPVSIPKPPQAPSPSLTNLARSLDLNIPSSLLSQLKKNGINTLEDIRNAGGGIGQIKGVDTESTTLSRVAAQKLEAHADLNRLSSDIQLNDTLIKHGYTSVAAIAHVSRVDFVNTARKKIGDFKAAQMHTVAEAQTSILHNILIGVQATNSTAGWGQGKIQTVESWRADHPILGTIAPPTCECADCDAAVSPRAYMADLLNYAIAHVKNNNSKIDLKFLVETFLQPFGDLPNSCDAVGREVRQVRICVEALRKYWESIKSTRPITLKASLQDTETKYCVAAYTTLLSKLGTSYDSIRLSRTLTDDDRKKSANRIGIDQAHLDSLLLDPVTESNLEEIFGLVDTNVVRNPLAAGRPSKLLQWREEYLSARWYEEDWLPDPYSKGLLPIIDPDIICPDDFRQPVIKKNQNDPDKSFDIWTRRRKWVDNSIKSLSSRTKVKKRQMMPDFDAMINSMYNDDINYSGGVSLSPPWEALRPSSTPPSSSADIWKPLESLQENLVSNNNNDTAKTEAAVKSIKTDLALTIDSFTKLMEIHKKDKQADNDLKSGKVKWEDWLQVFSILTQSKKERLISTWHKEEENKGVFLDTTEFWISVREPKDGNWPPVKIVKQPVIDPEIITTDDIPYDIKGRSTIRIWQERRAILDEDYEKLKTIREKPKASGGGFDPMFRLALGDPKPGDKLPHKINLKTLYTDLKSQNQNKAKKAKSKIINDLYMTPLAFSRLMYIKAKDDNTSPTASKPTAAEWNEVYSILASAQKIKRLYPRWAKEKNTIPKIVPEVLKLDDLPEEVAGKDALGLWQSRKESLEEIFKKLKKIREMPGTNAGRFDSMIREAIGHPDPGDALPPGQDLITLVENLRSNEKQLVSEAVKKITGRLYMTTEDFDKVMVIKDKNDSSDQLKKPTAAEWNEVYSILASAQMQKRKFAAWITEEQPFNYWDALKARLPKWLATAETRAGWQKALLVGNDLPIIDPDLITTGDLQTPTVAAAGPGPHPPRPPLPNPALGLWQSRYATITTIFNDLKNSREVPGINSQQWLELNIQKTVGQPIEYLQYLQSQRKNGINVTGRLQQLHLSYDALAHLLLVYELVTRTPPATVLDSEWEGVYSILVQIEKEYRFGKWRRDEHSQSIYITLSPIYFTIPPLDTTTAFPLSLRIKLPPWRATEAKRHDWQDKLQSRIDQKQAVVGAINDAISVTEEINLPMLRDGLLRVVGPLDNNLESNAKMFADRFLIDTKDSGCQKTTRISQAIETIQSLLFSLRTGQLNDTYAYLELDADDFDEEWEWIGSYTTWRAAMFVFLYPQNLLLPNLRKWKTPGFKDLVDKLRSKRQLTPEYACAAAKTYSDYFGDVCSLTLEASCQAVVRVQDNDSKKCQSQLFKTISKFFTFARSSGLTNTAYWSSYRISNYHLEYSTGYEQTFWQPLPQLKNIIKIVGAVPFKTILNQRFIFLFAHISDKDKQKLVFVKYNLDEPGWDAEPTELDPPKNVTSFTVVLAQKQGYNSAPKLVLRASDGTIYRGELNNDGSGWKQEDLEVLVDKEKGQYLELLDMAEDETFVVSGQDVPRFYLFVRNTEPDASTGIVRNNLEYRLFGDGSELKWRVLDTSNNNNNNWNWVGLVNGIDSVKLYAFWTRNSSQSASSSSTPPLGVTVYKRIMPKENLGTTSISNFLGFDSWLKILSSGYSLTDIKLVDLDVKYSAFGFTIWVAAECAKSFIYDLFTFLSLPFDSSARKQLRETPQSDGSVLVDPSETNYKRWGNDLIQSFQDKIYTGKFPGWGQVDSIIDANWAIPHPSNTKLNISSALYGLFANNLLTRPPCPQGQHWDDTQQKCVEGTAPSPQPIVYSATNVFASSTPPTGSYLVGLTRIAVNSDEIFFGNTKMVAYQRVGPLQGVWESELTIDSADLLTEVGGFKRIAPLVAGGLFEIPQQLSETDLQVRRKMIEEVFTDNKGCMQSILTYIEEAYYFVPVHIALQLQQRGQYTAALDWFRTVYDYSIPSILADQRKIYYGLKSEWFLQSIYERGVNWLQDPLNPHLIASLRRGSYTEFTLLSIIRCMLDFADVEFTRDTAESVPRARILYLTALDLLNMSELSQNTGQCEDLIRTLNIQVGDPQLAGQIYGLNKRLHSLNDHDMLAHVVKKGNEIFAGNDSRSSSLARKVARFQKEIDKAQVELQSKIVKSKTFSDMLEDSPRLMAGAHLALLAQPLISDVVKEVGFSVGQEFLNNVSDISGLSAKTLNEDHVKMPWLREKLTTSVSVMDDADPRHKSAPLPPPLSFDALLNNKDGVNSGFTAALDGIKTKAPLVYFGLGHEKLPPVPTILNSSFGFCIVPNPIVKILRLRAELNLYKIRNCRNIAGMQRQLEAYSAPTDTTSGLPTIGAGGQLVLPGIVTLRPTPYRYSALIERAKQLANMSAQIEAAFLSTLEKRDAEAYTLLKARQDMRLTNAGVQLQNLRVKEAQAGVDLAKLQQERAEIQTQTYEQWINAGLNQSEWNMIIGYQVAMVAQALLYVAQAYIDVTVQKVPWWVAASKAAAEATSSTALAIANINSVWASFERRKQEWELQKALAEQDIRIGAQQITIAEDHVRVVDQEKVIAEMQSDNAKTVVDFLSTKFTSVELYDWMSNILERIYAFFLQQATSMAQLASNQLAFERQEVPPTFIQADYWEAPSDVDTTEDTQVKRLDRRGLTGSARLLQDIYQLDQYAFETNKRKRQLTKTLSLVRLDPFAFQQFRQTGVMTFTTPMKLFDQDFPGDYMRLIKRVHISVIALIPPTQGIHATLSKSGLSRVVMGGDMYQTVVVRREPETIALTSPINATGLFDLEQQHQLQQSEMLAPFENAPVDSSWEFQLPKAANFFDYNTVADVLVTIEYTSLHSFDYRQQVIQQLDRKISADRPYSFRQQFADQWWDLHNPDQSSKPAMTVRFNTTQEDFPPNIEDLKIQHIVLYFVRANKKTFELPVTLGFTDGKVNVENDTISVDGVISSRKGGLISMIGKVPYGNWELALPDTEEIRNHFRNEEIQDILFVITYTGITAEWPI